ncbi:N-acetylmuramoyl-L-alanine amidase AmiC precursor [Eubacterium limosum]|uniref:N-acetylmuramoyl-L-alanine amidase AmiC n=1 Tax=Eubacterium limosum TaxID=1736 RepID=A0A6N3BY28_EUBLI
MLRKKIAFSFLMAFVLVFVYFATIFPVKAATPVIVINPGHLVGRDSGAVNNNTNIQEANLNAALAAMTAEKLKSIGYDVYLTHPVSGCSIPTLLTTQQVNAGYDSNSSLKTIGDAINAKNPDLAISIHHNSGGNASGYEFYWSSYRAGIDSEGVYTMTGLWPNDIAYLDSSPCYAAQRSKDFTNLLKSNFNSLSLPYRKTVERDDYIPAHTTCPSVLIEAGFVSNDAESRLLSSSNYQNDEANKIVNSINDFFGYDFDITAESITVSSVNNGKAKVTIKGVSGAGLSHVLVPTWSEANGQDDIQWYWANKEKDGTFSATIDVRNHNNESGTYRADAYAIDITGKMHPLGQTTVEMPAIETPKITADKVEVGTPDNGKAKVTISGLKVPSGVSFDHILVPTWSEANGQDDLQWYWASREWNGSYSVTIDVRNHNNESGTYRADAYAIDTTGKMHLLGQTTVEMPAIEPPKITADKVEVGTPDNGKAKVTISGLKVPSGVSFDHILVPTWSEANGQDDLQWYWASREWNGSYSVTIDVRNHNNESGTYRADAYAIDTTGKMHLLGQTTVEMPEIAQYHEISGYAAITYESLVGLYNNFSSIDFPSYYTENGRNVDLNRFAQLYIEEANAEGIRADVAFAQAMKETGWLKFGGQVSISQFNFAGLGATDDGAAGMSFAQKYGDNENGIRMGIRAQIQHLKAYASTEPLNNVCVDERFNLVKRGCAPYVEWLGQKENPNGYGWATGANYGQGIIDIMNRIP